MFLPAVYAVFLSGEDFTRAVLDKEASLSRASLGTAKEAEDLLLVALLSCRLKKSGLLIPELLPVLAYGCIADSVKAAVSS